MTSTEIEQAQPGDERRVLEALFARCFPAPNVKTQTVLAAAVCPDQSFKVSGNYAKWVQKANRFQCLLDAEAYLDAAMMLVEPAGSVAMLIENGTASVAFVRGDKWFSFEKATPALALCVAIARGGE